MTAENRDGAVPSAHYITVTDDRLQCRLCAHECILRDGQLGICGVRERRGNELYSLVYGKLVAENVDPIEKKPLFHVLPGTLSYSIATVGCNFRCRHCQNASISQVREGQERYRQTTVRSSEEVVHRARDMGCRSLSYTYVEPTVFFEFAFDCCLQAHRFDLKNVFVSNGYMTKETIELMAPVTDAINIDLKSFQDAFYKKVCGARLAPVLEAIALFKKLGVWVEVTTLIIPGKNDSDSELQSIADFLVSVDQELPWHVTGFYPTYQMQDVSPTTPEALARARQIGLDRGLRHVYTGNRPGVNGEDTFCPGCGATLVKRHGFQVRENRLADGRCDACGYSPAGIWG